MKLIISDILMARVKFFVDLAKRIRKILRQYFDNLIDFHSMPLYFFSERMNKNYN